MEESIKTRIAKLAEMARRGTENERFIAATKLDELMKKHGLTVAEITELVQPQTQFWFEYETKYERQLLIQIIAMVLNIEGSHMETYHMKKRRTVGADMTKMQAIDVRERFAHYKKELASDLDLALSAFFQRHQLYGKTSEKDKEYTIEQLEQIAKICQIANSLKSHRFPNTKRIEATL